MADLLYKACDSWPKSVWTHIESSVRWVTMSSGYTIAQRKAPADPVIDTVPKNITWYNVCVDLPYTKNLEALG